MPSNKTLHTRALRSIPGGVMSPDWSYTGFKLDTPFISHGRGQYIWDQNKKKYIDLYLAGGSLLLGHAHKDLVRALSRSAAKGMAYSAPHPAEVELAETFKSTFRGLEKVRFTGSRTEAVMGAVRAARAATKREKILKFRGSYHGQADYFLISSGSGGINYSIPDSMGVNRTYVVDTLLADYNDLKEVKRVFNRFDRGLAAVIIEPVAASMGLLQTGKEFINELKKICDENGTLLIFDESISGFHVQLGTTASVHGVSPDLTILGRGAGAGLPFGAFGGRRDIMDLLTPVGEVFQDTRDGASPLVAALALTQLKKYNKKALRTSIKLTEEAVDGIKNNIAKLGRKYQILVSGNMFCVHFHEHELDTYYKAKAEDTRIFRKYLTAMLKGGIYISPNPLFPCFISPVHTRTDIRKIIKTSQTALKQAT